MAKDGCVSLYFNLTYACNSACVFCGSDSPGVPLTRSMPAEAVMAAFRRRELGDGDEVVFNGGEPTLHPDLAAMIGAVQERGARVTLFTNGRRLGHDAYAAALVAAGVHRLTVPLHGACAGTHDGQTRRPGSFAQTLKGIGNAFRLRQMVGFPQQIELKLLATAAALPEWPDCVDLIATRLGRPDTLVLSGLHMWSTAVKGYGSVLPDIAALRQALAQTLARLQYHSIPTQLWSIPLCLIDGPDSLPQPAAEVGQAAAYYYYDPDYPEGFMLEDEGFDDSPHLLNRCAACARSEACGPARSFFWELTRAAGVTEM